MFTETTIDKDAGDLPPPEVPLPETGVSVPSTTAVTEEVSTKPSVADQTEKPTSPVVP